MPRVISYTRFSTKKQERGHSKERQDDKAIKWCAERGYELDLEASMHDPGYSAYAGDNISRGALGVLQRVCINGKLEKGTILLIEAFDRLTRLPLPQAYEMLLTLINNGLTIVTLTDGKEWNSKTMKSLESFMLSLVTLYRGFEESERKSERLRDTFEAARKQRKHSAFGSAPGWLKRDDKNSPWVVDEEKAEIVRKVFMLSAQGYGSKAIAKRANEEGWPVPMRLNKTTGRWHARMPGIILRNRAVTGYHEHKEHTHEAHAQNYNGVPTGVIHHDFYPRIVSDELWSAARASIASRLKDKRRDTHYYNIFSGKMFCGHCGAPIHRRTETKGYSRGTLSCADKVSGITKCPPCAAVTVDAPILEEIFKYQPSATISEEQAAELSLLEVEIKEKKKEIENITDTITKVGPLEALTDKLSMLSLELEIHTIAHDVLLVARENMYSQAAYHEGVLEEAIRNLYVPDIEARDYRAGLHLKIARLVDSIWIWGYEVAIIKFKYSGESRIVPLDYKRLPSRANSLARWHKPPKPKAPPHRPYLEAALKGTLTLPSPRRPAEENKHHLATQTDQDLVES